MKIVSLNIRHGGGKRIRNILNYLEKYDSEIIVVTEYRNNENGDLLITYLQKQGYSFEKYNGDEKENTVCIFSKLKFNNIHRLENHKNIVGIEINNIEIYGVYFPQKNEKINTYQKLKELIDKNTKTLIIGDFNTGISEYDTSNNSKFYCESEFKELSQNILRDSYRHKHGLEREYTWNSNSGNEFRIDHCLVSENILDKVNTSYEHSTRNEISDHSAMIVELDIRDDFILK